MMQGNWTQTFNGIFQGTNLDFQLFETMECWGDGASHSQYKMIGDTGLKIIWKPSQVQIANGICKLVTEKNEDQSESFVKSGMISTFRSLYQLYGYFECKMKVPFGGMNGGWAAFWAWFIGDKDNIAMECDIAEFINPTSKDYTSTIHSWKFGDHIQIISQTINKVIKKGITAWQKFINFFAKLFSGKIVYDNIYVDLSDDFHVYGLNWNKDVMEFYLDDVLQFTFPNYINNPMYMIIGLGISPTIKSTDNVSPITMEVGFVKAYKLK